MTRSENSLVYTVCENALEILAIASGRPRPISPSPSLSPEVHDLIPNN